MINGISLLQSEKRGFLEKISPAVKDHLREIKNGTKAVIALMPLEGGDGKTTKSNMIFPLVLLDNNPQSMQMLIDKGMDFVGLYNSFPGKEGDTFIGMALALGQPDRLKDSVGKVRTKKIASTIEVAA
jgi:hypothetical protein